MSRKRLVYSSSFKAKVALAAVKQDRTISELASHFKIHPQLVAKWKSHLLATVETCFQDGRKKVKPIEPSMEQLYQQIGQLKVELDFLKKKSEEFSAL
ncbi:MAG: transposase [Planctomycetaceae bacterium]|jgi:transposase|nr:transposase [Planctomycetaceae bacterium]